MTGRTNHNGLLVSAGRLFALIGAATASAAAVEGHRRPKRADLERLGIDPASFDRIRIG